MNGDGPVGRETREAVEAAIADKGYVPSNAARMMRSQKPGLIGVITGAISTAKKLTSRPAGLPDRVAPLISTFLQHRVEGLIYIAKFHKKVELPRLPLGTPMVLANCFDDIGTPSILPDDERGQHDLVARIAAAGHRRIAYLTLRNGISATPLRLQGYRAALAEAGIAYE